MKNTLIMTLSKFFEKGIMFIFFIVLAHYFGKSSFGEFSYYFTIASILFVLFDAGGEFYQIREFTKHESPVIFQNIFIFKTVIFLFIMLIILILRQPLSLVLLVFSFYIDAIISIFRSSFYKNGCYLKEALLTCVEKMVFGIIIFTNIITVNSFLIIYLSFIISKFTYLYLAIYKSYSWRCVYSTFRLFKLSFFKRYAANSWSYIIHALFVVIFVQIDIVMLKWMGVSFDDIGLYSAAVKIYFTVIIFADILFKQYYPAVSRYIYENNSSLKSYIIRIQNINIYASVFFALLTIFFADEIISASFGKEFVMSSQMLKVFSVVIVFRFSMYTYTALLSSSNLNYIKLVTSSVCVIINIVLNYILIPHYGVYGSIVATIVTEFVLVAMYKVSSHRIIMTNYFTLKEFLAIICVALSVYIFYTYKIMLFYKIMFLTVITVVLFFNRRIIKRNLSFEVV